MSKVTRTRTIVESCEVDDGEGFEPMIALGMAKGINKWEVESDSLLYQVTEGEQTFQLAGRLSELEGKRRAR